ncbi:MAG TPA: hypothetical protein VIN00_06500 [Candidatus Dormibacteraeota bacterium]
MRTSPTPTMTMFPAVRASNLNGRPFDLPGDFEGERNLVILAFQREQQALVDSWSPAIANLLARYADLCFYELPTISRGNLLFRAWLDGAMRAGIPARPARDHTITLYLDKAAFRQALDLPHEDTIYVLLFDRAGRVLWRSNGKHTAQLAGELEQVLIQGS